MVKTLRPTVDKLFIFLAEKEGGNMLSAVHHLVQLTFLSRGQLLIQGAKVVLNH